MARSSSGVCSRCRSICCSAIAAFRRSDTRPSSASALTRPAFSASTGGPNRSADLFCRIARGGARRLAHRPRSCNGSRGIALLMVTLGLNLILYDLVQRVDRAHRRRRRVCRALSLPRCSACSASISSARTAYWYALAVTFRAVSRRARAGEVAVRPGAARRARKSAPHDHARRADRARRDRPCSPSRPRWPALPVRC